MYVLSEQHSSVVGHSKCEGVLVCGFGSPFSVMEGCSVYSWFHGVMNVSVDFVVEIFSLFVWSHVSSM